MRYYIQFILSLFLFATSVFGAADEVPALPSKGPGRALVALQDGWKAMQESAPAKQLRVAGGSVLKFPCRFKGTRSERGYWDHPLSIDLTTARCIRFQIYCPNRASIRRFMAYLRSGSGWYVVPFDVESSEGWNTVVLDKGRMETEGQPGGWSRVDLIRLAAWRGGDEDTAFYVTDVRVQGSAAATLVIRGDAANRLGAGAAKAVATFTGNVTGQLDALGLPFGLISDQDVTSARLKGATLVILPHNPEVPAAMLTALKAYLKQGGRLICFYLLPAELEDSVGIRRGEHTPPAYPGQFAGIRPAAGNPLKLPAHTAQNSWNIYGAQPIAGQSVTVAEWVDSKGKPTGRPAIIASENGLLMTHVLVADDPQNKRELLLAMLGRFKTEVWQQAAQAAVIMAGRFGPYAGTADARIRIERSPHRRAETTRLLGEADQAYGDAVVNLKRKDYAGARAAAARCTRKLTEAHCSIQVSKQDEFRGMWCHDALGVPGWTWDETVKRLAEHGFTAVMPNMAWGATAFYQSQVLPGVPEMVTQGDQIALCAAACRRYGIECHVWKICWKMGWKADDATIERMTNEGRVQVSRSGRTKPRWLCPSHPKNRALEIESLVEIVQKYDIAGIHLDYIRYPDESYCFCSGCRERFEAVLGRPVPNWPKGIEEDRAIQRRWLTFRRGNITGVVKAVSEGARAIKPGLKISAAVFSNWLVHRDSVAQDWKLWCGRGWLDFVCPMDYTTSQAQFEHMVKRQLEWAGDVPCYPGIGLSTWSRAGDICRLIDQVSVARRVGAPGFMVFELGPSEARDVLPLCGLGLTRAEGSSQDTGP